MARQPDLRRADALEISAVTPLGHPRRRSWQFGLATLVLLTILGSLLIARATTRAKPARAAAHPAPVYNPPAEPPPAPSVWMVEKSAELETYSNGLRIDTRFEGPNHRLAYVAFPAGRPDDAAGVHRSAPAGIVFHTTESQQLPFDASSNAALKQVGEGRSDICE